MSAQLLYRATEAIRAGRAAEAERLCRDVLRAEPRDFDALLMLGHIQQQAGRLDNAEKYFADAVAVRPNATEAHYMHGCALQGLGRNAEAISSYDRVLAADVAHPEPFVNRGVARLALNRHTDALADFNRALIIRPGQLQALINRGSVFAALKRPEDAETDYRTALTAAPNSVEAWNNLGTLQLELGRYEEALASFDKALAFNPAHVDMLLNRTKALKALGRGEEALLTANRAISLQRNSANALHVRAGVLILLKRYNEAQADYMTLLSRDAADASAHCGLGNVFGFMNRVADAIAAYGRAINLNPDYPEALVNCANLLFTSLRPGPALAGYDAALKLEPESISALNGRANALFALKRYDEAITAWEDFLKFAPDFPYALGAMLEAKTMSCNWDGLDTLVLRINEAVRAGKPAISSVRLVSISDSETDIFQCSRVSLEHRKIASAQPVWRGKSYRHERLRIAYLSADFREHAVSYKLAGVYEHHDRTRFETYAIDFGHDDGSGLRKRLTSTFDQFIGVTGKSDLEVAQLLKQLEIDIAVDLMGYTQGCQPGIFATRPAPLTMSYLGFPGTMATDAIDYILADRIVLPEEHHLHYSEKVVTMPHSYQGNDDKCSIGPTPTRADAGLPQTGFVFCCINNSFKIMPPVFAIWMRLLRAVDGSVLWLLADNEFAPRNLRREAQAAGVDPGRLIFAPRVPMNANLARQQLADLYLDTAPYCAHGMSSDALWAGLPLLTCMGKSFAGRVSSSLLHAVGMPELITDSLEAYEVKALSLARDSAALSAIRAKLAANRENWPLFDTKRFTRNLEAAYIEMWKRQERGEPPASFAVADQGR